MKKAFSHLILFVVIFAATLLLSFAYAENVCVAEGGFTIEDLDGTYCAITGYIGTAEVVVIPETINGKTVREIAKRAFMNNETITQVTFPASLKTIGREAFYNCSSLTTVELNEGLEEISRSAFENCKALTEITIPEGVTTIGMNAFSGCSTLESVTLLGTVTDFYEGVFSSCTGLTTVNLPATLTKIPNNTFQNCEALTEITIPEGVTTIGDYAFECTGLVKITLPDSITTIGSRAFYNCTNLSEVNIPLNWTTVSNSDGNVCESPFVGCSSLKTVTIPEGKTSLPQYAFKNAKGIETVNLPSTLQTINNEAFSGCTALKNIIFLKDNEGQTNITSIGESAFQGCTSLEEVDLPASLGIIERWSFADCSSLTTVNLKVGLKEISRAAFEDCVALKNITLPEGVTLLGMNAFSGCSALESMTIPRTVTELFYPPFDDTLILYVYPDTAAHIFARDYNYTYDLIEEEVCEHDFEETIITPPTCTQEGSRKWVCTKCGEVLGPEIIPATEHDYDEGTVTAPTCTEQGYTTYTCKNCEDSYTDDYVPALGHAPGGWETTQEATCTEDGEKEKRCTRCDEVLEQGTIPASGHDYEGTVTAPTCTEQGYTTYTCKNCEDSYTDDYVPALGHTYGDWVVEEEPTVDEEGLKYRECEVCHHQETEVIPKLDPPIEGINISNYNGIYDGNPHTISVEIPAGATIKYGLDAENCDLDTVPSYVDAGVYTIYYLVTMTDHQPHNGSALVTITPKELTVEMITISDSSALVYTGSQIKPPVTVTDGTPNIITAEDYVVSYGANINVADGGSVTVTGKGNYQGTVTKSFAIAKAPLTVWAGDQTVTYGEPIAITIHYDGFVNNEPESVLLSPAVAGGFTAQPAVGTYAIVLSGAVAENYDISYNANATLTVNPKDITITALEVFDKPYDGNTDAIINVASLLFSGVLEGDEISLKLENATASFASSAVGENIPVEISGLAITGEDAPNYHLVTTTFTTTANITSAQEKEEKVTINVTAERNGTVTGGGLYLKDSVVTVVATPNRGYKFSGWYKGNELVSTSAVYSFTVGEDMALIARFTKRPSKNTYTISFVTNDGSVVSFQNVQRDKAAAEPPVPIREGYTFLGWYTDSALTQPYDFTSEVTNSLTLYAKWEKTDVTKQIVMTVDSPVVKAFGQDIRHDVAPKIVRDRVMLPARMVAESLGGIVDWDEVERKVTITKGEIEIILFIGSDKAYVNGQEVLLDSPVFIENNRTYTPVRFVAERLGATVDWNDETRQAIITK